LMLTRSFVAALAVTVKAEDLASLSVVAALAVTV
jgi:hypothetical protein